MNENKYYGPLDPEIYDKLPGRTRLLINPFLYATGAAACIKHQLTTVKSNNRRIKLENKLIQWIKVIELLKRPNEEETNISDN